MEGRVSEGLTVDLGSFAGQEMARRRKGLARRKGWVRLFAVVVEHQVVELALTRELARSGWL